MNGSLSPYLSTEFVDNLILQYWYNRLMASAMTPKITAKLNTSSVPPQARKIPTQTTQLGFTRHDDYAWMKDENWQAVMVDTSKLDLGIREHLEAENAYTEAVTKDLTALKDEIFEEMKGRLKADAASVPSPDGIWACLLYTSPSPRDRQKSRMPSSA